MLSQKQHSRKEKNTVKTENTIYRASLSNVTIQCMRWNSFLELELWHANQGEDSVQGIPLIWHAQPGPLQWPACLTFLLNLSTSIPIWPHHLTASSDWFSAHLAIVVFIILALSFGYFTIHLAVSISVYIWLFHCMSGFFYYTVYLII